MDLNQAVPLYLVSQIKELEARAYPNAETRPSVLMERAGRAAFELLLERFPLQNSFNILCGTGNNGGDGFVIARLAHKAGITPNVFFSGEPTASAARKAFRVMKESGVEPLDYTEFSQCSSPVVDCILGTGLQQAPRGLLAELIEKINLTSVPVFAVDIPSGLNANTGHAPGVVVKADFTLSFIAKKPGLLTGFGPEVCGDLQIDSLGLDADLLKSNIFEMSGKMFTGALPARPRNSHKANYGHVLVIGGDQGYAGAALMAAEASARAGAGLVSVITHSAHAAQFVVPRPELMVYGIESTLSNELLIDNLLTKSDVVIFGPGLGKKKFGRSLFPVVLNHLIQRKKLAVIDADALNLLAENPSHIPNAIMTPHPGEAARLLKQSIAEINSDRISAVKQLYQDYHSVSLLKGSGSVIFDGELTYLTTCGNPGMASAGMGDVLSGITGGLLAQHLPSRTALAFSVWLHGTAGDKLAKDEGERGLLASDLVPQVRNILKYY